MKASFIASHDGFLTLLVEAENATETAALYAFREMERKDPKQATLYIRYYLNSLSSPQREEEQLITTSP